MAIWLRPLESLPRALAARAPILTLIIALQGIASPASADGHRRRIYFLETLAPTQPAAVRTIRAFEVRLAEKTTEKFDVFVDYMELERLPGQAHIDSTVRYLAEKYAEAPPDILIPLGRAAVPFMVKYRDVIAPQVPVIIANVPSRSIADGNNLKNTLWVATEYNFAKTLELAADLQPDSRNIALVGGASEYDRSWVDDALRELQPYLDRYNVTQIIGKPYDATLADVSRLPADTIVLMSYVFQDGSGLSRLPPDVASAVAKVSPAPVYSPISSFFGRGIVGGYMDSFEAHGTAAANLAYEILSGKNITELPRQTEPQHQYEIDERQLERWRLSPKKLPSAAVVSFRTPTLWDQHRELIIAGLAIFALQSGLLGVLVFQSSRRRIAEAEAAEQRREVAHLMRVSVLGELSGAIAHEINQPLAAIMWNAESAIEQLKQYPPDLAKIREAVDDIVIEDSRAGNVIMRLRSLLKKGERKFESVDINELITSTLELMNSELVLRQVSATTDLTDDLPAVSGDTVQLQQLLINLFMNAMDAMASIPHQQRHMVIHTGFLPPDKVEMRIRDFGSGITDQDKARLFEPFFTSKEQGLGLGLTICSTIAQAHGGSLVLDNHPDKGAQALLSLPAHQRFAAAR